MCKGMSADHCNYKTSWLWSNAHFALHCVQWSSFCCLMEKNTQISSNHLESSDNFPQRHGVVMAHSVAEWLFCWLEHENETPTIEHQWVSANGSVMSVFFGCAVQARHSGRCRGAGGGRPGTAADTNIHYEVRLYQAKVALFPFCH